MRCYIDGVINQTKPQGDKMEIEKLEKELSRIIKKFDIPDHRKTCETIHNYKWLHKNIGERNSGKEEYARAMEILEILVKEKR